jgi:ATP-dependent RNA helicase DeaD
MSFKDLGLPDFLLRALDDRGYDIPTEIQEKTIKAFSSGKHIVGQSQTGSGKTAAFVLPMLQAINTRQREPQVLMLAPTRELAAQIREEIFSLSKYMRMMSLCAVGGTSKRKQVRILRKGPQIVVGTPGRIEDLLDSHVLKPGSIDYFILDEVDRMLDMGFIESIRRIWQRLDTVKQTMTFSATLPKEAKHLLSDFIGNDYTTIKISEEVVVDKVDHTFLNLQQYDKYAFLTELLNNNPDFKVLIFAETKRRVDQLASKLR